MRSSESPSDSSRPRISPVVPMALALALPVTLAAQREAQALTFRFDYGNNVSDDFKKATEDAASLWSSALKDDVAVDLRIEYADMSNVGPILGGTLPGRTRVKYEDYVDALLSDSISSKDYVALNNLPLSSKGYAAVQAYQGSNKSEKVNLDSKDFSFLMDSQFSRGQSQADFVDGNGNDNNKHVMLTNAQARALGLSESYQSGLDGVIRLNSSVDWDLDQANGVDHDKYDVSTVLKHEIGHVLGFVSGSDTLDFLASSSAPIDFDKDNFSYLTPFDLYRYSQESTKLGVSDLTLGGDAKYFSLDGGQTAVTDENGRQALFSTGSKSVGGDGFQGSHWKADGNPLGIMTPVLSKGQAIDISQLDLTLLDVVGWDLKDSNAEQAAAIGLNWSALTGELARDHQAVTEGIISQWGQDIPEIEGALSDAAIDIESKFREKFQEDFEKLVEKLSDEDDSNNRDKEVDKFYENVDKLAADRNKDLRELPEDIYKTDSKIREWLEDSADKLSEEMKDADGATINRLSNIVKAAPASERAELEPKLEAALANFSNKPNKVLKQLLDTRGPVNPVSWAAYYRLWWWAMEAADESDPLLYAATAAEAFPELSLAEQSVVLDGFTRYAKAAQAEDGSAPVDFAALQASNATSILQSSSAGNGSDLASNFVKVGSTNEAEDIPEPSSVLAVFGIAALGAGLRRRQG